MKKKLFILTLYLTLSLSNIFFLAITRLIEVGWKPYPSFFDVLLFPLAFIFLVVLVMAILNKEIDKIYAPLIWFGITGIIFLINYFDGIELISLLDQNAFFITGVFDYFGKKYFTANQFVIELLIYLPFTFVYQFLALRISDILSSRIFKSYVRR